MSRFFGIAGIQMQVAAYDPEATLAKMEGVARNVITTFPWVQLVMFHELAVAGVDQFVTLENPEWLQRKNVPIPGQLTNRLCMLAQKLGRWLVPGSLYELEGDKVYNTAIVISPRGEIVTKYRKIFPWLPYEQGVTPGRDYCIFDIPGAGRFGLCICYDMWFPEVARTLAWMGAEVILQPTSTPTSDRELELVMCRANALFNQCFYVTVNSAGTWGGGRSSIIDPDGRILQEASTNQTILTELIDLDHVSRTREYGTIGLSQTLKQLRDCGQSFPLYEAGKLSEGSFSSLGPLRLHAKEPYQADG